MDKDEQDPTFCDDHHRMENIGQRERKGRIPPLCVYPPLSPRFHLLSFSNLTIFYLFVAFSLIWNEVVYPPLNPQFHLLYFSNFTVFYLFIGALHAEINCLTTPLTFTSITFVVAPRSLSWFLSHLTQLKKISWDSNLFKFFLFFFSSNHLKLINFLFKFLFLFC